MEVGGGGREEEEEKEEKEEALKSRTFTRGVRKDNKTKKRKHYCLKDC